MGNWGLAKIQAVEPVGTVAMVQYNPLQMLPTEADLPETDHRPVDNELQILIPTLLRAVLAQHWVNRSDWFFGVNLGVYYDPDQAAIGPDGLLSLGVPRLKPDGKLRLSYLLWRENNVVPQWILEIVSKTAGEEYGEKMHLYASMGVLYYTIYNPEFWRRDQHEAFEVYHLINGTYVRQPGNPVWMPEIGLGIGYEQGTQEGLTREWLYWYDAQGNRLLSPGEQLAQEREQLAQEREQLAQERRWREALLEKLRQRGIDPDSL